MASSLPGRVRLTLSSNRAERPYHTVNAGGTTPATGPSNNPNRVIDVTTTRRCKVFFPAMKTEIAIKLARAESSRDWQKDQPVTSQWTELNANMIAAANAAAGAKEICRANL